MEQRLIWVLGITFFCSPYDPYLTAPPWHFQPGRSDYIGERESVEENSHPCKPTTGPKAVGPGSCGKQEMKENSTPATDK